MSSVSSTSGIFGILQSAYAAPTQVSIPPGSKFANVDPTQWQGSWTGKDSNGKPVSIKVSNVSGYRASVRFQSADGGLQTGRVYINTNSVFRIGNSQVQLTSAGKMTVNTVITDPTTGNESMETDYVTLQSGS
jgi:hypothetical protein